MGVQVHIDDDAGQTYRAWSNSDSKMFAQLLMSQPFWHIFTKISHFPIEKLTTIVAEQHVPNRLKTKYNTWKEYHQSRFQPIEPLVGEIEQIITFLQQRVNWLHLLQQEWVQDKHLQHFMYDYYFEEGGFLSDLEGLRTRLNAIKQTGARNVCLYLL